MGVRFHLDKINICHWSISNGCRSCISDITFLIPQYGNSIQRVSDCYLSRVCWIKFHISFLCVKSHPFEIRNHVSGIDLLLWKKTSNWYDVIVRLTLSGIKKEVNDVFCPVQYTINGMIVRALYSGNINFYS